MNIQLIFLDFSSVTDSLLLVVLVDVFRPATFHVVHTTVFERGCGRVYLVQNHPVVKINPMSNANHVKNKRKETFLINLKTL